MKKIETNKARDLFSSLFIQSINKNISHQIEYKPDKYYEYVMYADKYLGNK